jgi:hypothetical protein
MISLNSINQLIFVIVKCGVLSEVRTEFLNIIWMCFGFKGLIRYKTSFNALVVNHTTTADVPASRLKQILTQISSLQLQYSLLCIQLW